MKVYTKKQKCQSIRIKITEIQDGTIGQGLTLSALTFEVGAKAGTYKSDQDAHFGATTK